MAYLLATIFFVAPLAFSHFFLLFRVPIVFDRFGNYEGPKLAIITVLLIFAAVFLIVDSVKKMPFQKYFGLMIAGITSISIWIIHGIFWAGMFAEFFWIFPFYSGFFSIILLLFIFFLLSQLSKKEMLVLEKSALAALFLVGIYAAIQKFGVDPIDYGIPFGSGRVFSTLGNPNTFAIYCLSFLPLMLLGYQNPWKWLVALFIMFGIAASGSISVFFLAITFFIWAICFEAGAPFFWYLFCFLFLWITALQWAIPLLGSGEKYFSIMTRFVIWNEGFRFLFFHPSTILWGTSQSEILSFLNESRSTNLLRYIPEDSLLLHFHNTWFDFLFQLGFLWLSGIGYGLYSWYQKQKLNSPHIFISTLILVVASGFFHHLEMTNWIILAWMLFMRRQEISYYN